MFKIVECRQNLINNFIIVKQNIVRISIFVKTNFYTVPKNRYDTFNEIIIIYLFTTSLNNRDK